MFIFSSPVVRSRHFPKAQIYREENTVAYAHVPTHAYTLDKLLTTLYAAPTHPELWNNFLKEFGEISSVNKAALISHRFDVNEHKMLATLGDGIKDRENIRLYEEFYCQVDEWTRRFPKTENGRLVRGQEIWATEAMLQSTFFNEFLKKVDVLHMVCVAFSGSPGNFEALSLYRGPHEDEFDSEELDHLAQIVPHLQTALYTRRKLLELESRASDMETALDALSTALVLVSATDKILFANRNARAILGCRDGLISDGGRLMAQDTTECAALRAVLAGAISFGTGKAAPKPQAMLISRVTKRPLQLVAVPCRPETLAISRKAAAFVFIADPDQKAPSLAETLHALFRLTHAEVRLATVLLEGKSLSEAAQTNEVGKETVRSQLKSIFLKTGARRQSELISLLLKLPGDTT
jgi:DNA-binding CsgD family transcriptional regulator/PAS domain-containing protein